MQNPKCPLPIGTENTKFLNHSIPSQEADRVTGKRFGNEQCLPTAIPFGTILKKFRIHIKVFFKSFIRNWKFLNELNHWGQILFNKISSHCTTLLICMWQKGKEENTQKSWVWEVWTLRWRNPGPWKLNVFIYRVEQRAEFLHVAEQGWITTHM